MSCCASTPRPDCPGVRLSFPSVDDAKAILARTKPGPNEQALTWLRTIDGQHATKATLARIIDVEIVDVLGCLIDACRMTARPKTPPPLRRREPTPTEQDRAERERLQREIVVKLYHQEQKRTGRVDWLDLIRRANQRHDLRGLDITKAKLKRWVDADRMAERRKRRNR